jgi:hypothetical protein
MRWEGHVAQMGEGSNVYRVLLGKLEGRGPLERPRRRWEDGIKMDLRVIGWGVEWNHLVRYSDRWAVMNAVMNLGVLAPRLVDSVVILNTVDSMNKMRKLPHVALISSFVHCGRKPQTISGVHLKTRVLMVSGTSPRLST